MDKIIAVLLWILPVSLCLHVIEEFIFPGGFIKWYHNYRPKFATVTPSYYLKLNTVAIVASFILAITTNGRNGYRAFLIVCGYLSCNAIFTHIQGAVKTRQYSPGIITGSFLFLPLTVISYVYFLKTGTVDLFSAIICLVVSPLFELVLYTIRKPGMKN